MAIAGVLLVFCYLIVPSVAAMLYADSIGKRLAIGWTMGTIVSALGVYLSLQLDLPTGATIVCTFGLVLIIMAAVRPLVERRHADRHGEESSADGPYHEKPRTAQNAQKSRQGHWCIQLARRGIAGGLFAMP